MLEWFLLSLAGAVTGVSVVTWERVSAEESIAWPQRLMLLIALLGSVDNSGFWKVINGDLLFTDKVTQIVNLT